MSEKVVEAKVIEESGRNVVLAYTCPYCGSPQTITVTKTKKDTIPVACFDCYSKVTLKIVRDNVKKSKKESKVEVKKEVKTTEKKDVLDKVREWIEKQDKIAESVEKPYFNVLRLFGMETEGKIYGIWVQYINGDKRVIRVIFGKRKGSYFGKTTIPIVDIEDLENYYKLLKSIFEVKERVNKLDSIIEYIRAGTPRRAKEVEVSEEEDLL